jgi:hypothetical protein
MALTDIGPGDGATMVIPGSHKSNFVHPNAGEYAKLDRMDTLEGAVEVHLKKGDALLFVDGIMHGGSSRTNTEGERRVVIYRYGPGVGCVALRLSVLAGTAGAPDAGAPQNSGAGATLHTTEQLCSQREVMMAA